MWTLASLRCRLEIGLSAAQGVWLLGSGHFSPSISSSLSENDDTHAHNEFAVRVWGPAGLLTPGKPPMCQHRPLKSPL